MEALYRLKISLMSHGMQVTPEARGFLAAAGVQCLSAFDYVTTSGMVLILPGDIYVNVNFRETFCKKSENILDYRERLILRSPFLETEASFTPVPGYVNRRLSSGRLARDVIMTHADRMRISPVRGCANRCQFCDMGTASSYCKADIGEIDEALNIALTDPLLHPKHLLISGGAPFPQDIPWLDSIYEHIIKTSPVPTDVMMTPRENDDILERLLAWGCAGIAINLEINDEAMAQKIMPEKNRLGKDVYLQFIEKAVRIFGRGAVRSCVILGLENPESTLEGIKCLAQVGCDPVLSTFKPLKNTALENILPPSPAIQEYIFEEAEKMTRRYGVLLGPRCIPCQHNTLTFPLKGEKYFFH